jgi:preprotein translocase subunit SecD
MAYGKEGDSMIKYWRLMLLIVTVVGAIFAIGMKTYPYGRDGVEILYVSSESPAKGLLEQGMIITMINGEQVNNIDDWNRLTVELDRTTSVKANNKDFEISTHNTTSLGIEAMNIERTNLDFGLDLRGGTRIILSPKEKNISADIIEQVMATLQTRANLYGLREIKFFSIKGTEGHFIQVEAAGIGRKIVDDLLSSQGRFEAKISKPATVTGNSAEFQLGSDKYPIGIIGNDTLEINGSTIRPNETFIMEGIGFRYVNKTVNTLMFVADVLDGKDVEIVFSDPQRSGILPIQGGYRFYFTIQVSVDGAQRFAEVTAGVPRYIDIYSGDEFLKDSEILLYLDDQIVSSLRISSGLQGQAIQTPQITGSRTERDEAIEEKLKLQTILRSGALPTTLETMSVDVISPTLGEGFFTSAINAALLAAGVVVVIIFLRYRRLKIAIPLILIGLSEVIIILGIAAKNDAGIWSVVLVANAIILMLALWKKQEIDIYAWIGALLIPVIGMVSWTIDLAVIGGIIAAIGTGMDQLIIISDETLSGAEKKLYTIREKIKRAFFIIAGAAFTTIAAMLPLMFLGIGLIRGFAITTIVGVLVGILITRPAFARIIEREGD